MQLRRIWSAWTQRGLWCAGRVLACQTWTVTKSLGGSPTAAWQESWSSPAHKRSEGSPHTNTLFCSVEGLEKAGQRHSCGNFTEEGLWWDSHRYCMLLGRGHETVGGPCWIEWLGEKRLQTTRDWKQSQMERNAKRKDSIAQREKLYPTGGKTLVKDQKLFRWLIYFL